MKDNVLKIEENIFDAVCSSDWPENPAAWPTKKIVRILKDAFVQAKKGGK